MEGRPEGHYFSPRPSTRTKQGQPGALGWTKKRASHPSRLRRWSSCCIAILRSNANSAATLLLLLLRRLREEAKQDGEAAEDTLFTYPKPQVETLLEELATVRERLETVSEQLLRAQDAIGLVVEALSKDAQSGEELGQGKLQIAFDLLRDEPVARGCYKPAK